jgi:precorrin-2 dehydrogenase / sirohydrochlorin ferrochelatase
VLPLALDLSAWPVLLAGDGPAALKRLDMLEAAGAVALRVFAPEPSTRMRERAGTRLAARMPTDEEVAAARLLFVAGVAEPEAARLAAVAHAHRVLVNVEDVPDLCDAYALAMVRRGDLVIGVSTEGRSPAVAALLRAWLEERFGPEWAGLLEDAAALRAVLRAEGAAPAAVMAATRDLLGPRLGGSAPPPDIGP